MSRQTVREHCRQSEGGGNCCIAHRQHAEDKDRAGATARRRVDTAAGRARRVNYRHAPIARTRARYVGSPMPRMASAVATAETHPDGHFARAMRRTKVARNARRHDNRIRSMPRRWIAHRPTAADTRNTRRRIAFPTAAAAAFDRFANANGPRADCSGENDSKSACNAELVGKNPRGQILQHWLPCIVMQRTIKVAFRSRPRTGTPTQAREPARGR